MLHFCCHFCYRKILWEILPSFLRDGYSDIKFGAKQSDGKQEENLAIFWLDISTDYGRPMKPFFIEIPHFWAWADKFWGIWGIFERFISTHFGTVSPLSMFSINQPIFLQKNKPLYPNPKYVFGIEIWIWATKN